MMPTIMYIRTFLNLVLIVELLYFDILILSRENKRMNSKLYQSNSTYCRTSFNI